ncbi:MULTISPECIES: 2,3-butanediol dehydrogenase [unclassified Pseudofrankia]|uniref:2,3-butanediol dehydrogenase n=1 Tax=unclassified Pseudofrankia TaxID=2994372 RepID=UPI0008DA0AF2|nr:MULTISPECIES: 2,3-butanediol dehydrogenase [unclassified Pseudofrankia]MDT3444666.1 2,3-butanediol dehydrogenase [Pseudofrankia sp. BMG5.37]OHV66591.1 dehydrogenase [Pseudofrankia sp. BMG5.36]
MRAAVYRGQRQVEVEDVPDPSTGDGQVKVRVSRNGICGTDVHEYYAGPLFIPRSPHPLTGQQLPLTLGHEFSGTVTEVGRGVTEIYEGDRVVIEPTYRCGECRACRSGHYNLCRLIGFPGLSGDGGMAEYAVLPQIMIHKLPDAVRLDMAALVEPMAVAYHAAALGAVKDQERALIFGAGPIGIGLWFALRADGVTEIDVVEPSASRRAAIEGLGARILDPTTEDVTAIVLERTRGEGVDAVYDAAGVASVVQTALDCLAERRTLVCVAVYDEPVATSLLDVMMREKSIKGAVSFKSGDFPAVIDLMAKGYYDTTGWVETIPMTAVVSEGFEELRAGRKMKLLIDPTL